MSKFLFISHATPQDNDFAIWIASRLEMLGYSVWIDKEGLIGGERFWATIQKAIQNSQKVLFIYSKNIVTDDGVLKQGIENEIEYAKSIATQNSIANFIIPLHIDDSAFNLAIGLPNLNHIPFNDSWADGLKQLLKRLEKDGINKDHNTEESSFSEWYENEYISNCSIIDKKELFYTSWWQIKSCPDTFYIYKFNNKQQAEAVRNANDIFPVSLQSNMIISFSNELNWMVKHNGEDIQIMPEQIYSYTINDILYGFESDKFPSHLEVTNLYKRLLSLTIHNLFRKRGLRKFELSNKKYAYYQPKYEGVKSVKFIYPYTTKQKKKALLGQYKGNTAYWHYAISVHVNLEPIVGFVVKPHIIFTSDGFTPIDDDKKMHSYRREKGKNFFNEAWRDLFLAFIQNLKDSDSQIRLQISKNNDYIEMKQWPEMFWSDKGYYDPNSTMSLDKVEDYVEYIEEEEL